MATHGTVHCYNTGCRRPECKQARAAYVRARSPSTDEPKAYSETPYTRPDGFVVQRVGRSKTPQFVHRLVMADAIGRPLRPNERVKHRDEDRGHNDLENLDLIVRSAPADQRVQTLVAWAREMLADYEEIAARLPASS